MSIKIVPYKQGILIKNYKKVSPIADFLTICIFRESLVGLLGLASSVANALASIGERHPASWALAKLLAMAFTFTRNSEIVRKSANGPFLLIKQFILVSFSKRDIGPCLMLLNRHPDLT